MVDQSIAFTPQSSLVAVVSLSAVVSGAISFSPSSSLAASLAMTVSKTVAIAAGPASSINGSLAMTVSKTVAVAAGPASSINGSLAMTASKTVAVAAGPASSINGSLAMTVAKTIAVAAGPTSALKGSLALSGVAGVTFCQVVNEVLNLWGIEGTCNAPDFAIERAVADVNSAIQTIWNQAADRNYWTGSTLTLTFTSAASSQDLPSNIQNVVGPCRRADNKRPLATIGTIGELETFSDLYLDGETADEPLAYHIERMNQAGQDPAKTVLHITPPVVGADVDLLLEVVTEAPRFYVGDLSECPILPIPHRYTESLLMPIVRYKASSFWLFNNGESKPTIDRDYQLAMEAIGAADPLPGKSGDNKEVAKK